MAKVELKLLFETSQWSGWATFLLGAFIFIPDWQSRLSFWLDTLRQVSGSADMVAEILFGPYVGMALIFVGLAWIMIVAFQTEHARARQWMPLAGWTIFVVFVIVLSSLALFMEFFNSSNIPVAMKYFAEKSDIRHISNQKKDLLKSNLLKIKDQIPTLSMIAERDTETLQYALDVLDVLKMGGIKVEYGGKEEIRPAPEDLYDTSLRGIMIGVKFTDAPTRPAILLMRIFTDAGLEPNYIAVEVSRPEDILLIIGPK